MLLVAASVTACSGNDTSGPRPLNVDEASRLAGTMHLNHLAGSVRFEVNTLDRPGGDALRLAGIIDWSTSSGMAAVSSDAPGSGLTGVVWKEGTVLERRPALDARLAALGAQMPTFVARPVNKEMRVDQVLSVVAALATKQPENALLLQQKEGTAFLRADTLRGTAVDVMRYGARSIFWVDTATGVLMRFEGNTAAGNQPVIVDLFPAEGEKVQFPRATQVVDPAAHPELAAVLGAP